MEEIIGCLFRFVFYVFFGISLEVIFAVHGIEQVMGCKIPRRVPKKYLEGFISVYMFPLHGLGLLFAFEPVYSLIADWFVIFRFLFWALSITCAEIIWGIICQKVLGFYSWDYYALSKYRIFKKGYSLWTLVPLWGVAGLVLEFYSSLLIYLSPHVAIFVKAFFAL